MSNEALDKAIATEGRRIIREALETWAEVNYMERQRHKERKPMPMTMNRYQQLASRTINWDGNIANTEMHALHGMAAEVGELHSLYQKMYQGHQFDKEHAKKEVGDLLWFVAEYCTVCGLTLEEVAQANIDKLKARYPDGFDTERSLHRAEGDI